jgi:hypothetical protein
VVAEAALIAAFFHDSVTGIVTTALAVACALLAAGRIAPRAPSPAQPPPGPARGRIGAWRAREQRRRAGQR